MHIYFSGIGGTAIGPLAMIAKQAGYQVSGSDKMDSQYIQYLRKHGIDNITIGQTIDQIATVHEQSPIDWLVVSSAVAIENPNHPELNFCQANGIKTSKRDELLNQIINERKLQLLAVAGTHGKTTTTAMIVWLYKQLSLPLSFSVGAKMTFADMGAYAPGSSHFAYECDEFDRNFLAFNPAASLITGVTWDHHEIFPTRDDYKKAFTDFIDQSTHTYLWDRDAQYLNIRSSGGITILDSTDPRIDSIQLLGRYNREDAWLVIQAVNAVTDTSTEKLINLMSAFPGTQRRFEQLATNVYSDYAHTPEKIRGLMSVAREYAAETKQNIVIVYEPLTNRRQAYMLNDYGNCFEGAQHVYWLPSYLAREDPSQAIITPEQLISKLADPSIATASIRDDDLWNKISAHRQANDLVIGIAGGGGNSLDEWLRAKLTAEA